jgi:hypothetical protein
MAFRVLPPGASKTASYTRGREDIMQSHDSAGFALMRAELHQDYAPANAQERLLVDEVATCWRRLEQARQREDLFFDLQKTDHDVKVYSQILRSIRDAGIAFDRAIRRIEQVRNRRLNLSKLSRNRKEAAPNLKVETQTNHDNPIAALRSVHRSDAAEVGIVDVRVRVAEDGRIGGADCVHSQNEFLTFSDANPLQHIHVDVEEARTSEEVRRETAEHTRGSVGKDNVTSRVGDASQSGTALNAADGRDVCDQRIWHLGEIREVHNTVAGFD